MNLSRLSGLPAEAAASCCCRCRLLFLCCKVRTYRCRSG